MIGKHGSDILPLLLEYGDDAVDIIRAYGDEGISLLVLYGDDAVKLIDDYGTPAVNLMLSHGGDAIDLVGQYDDDVFRALDGRVVSVGAKNVNEFANALEDATGYKVWSSPTTGMVYVSKSTDEALDASKMLKDALARGDQDEVTALIQMIAAGPTRGSGNRVILGTFAEGGGYIGNAVDNGGIFFDTGDDVWG
ncbi:MAG: hypothetical protein QY332_18120 [Anaerolineales bacterium]|nr:MAG: hypothetical protein QY332_18120 [Anaerolineales bacterium]